MTLRSSAVTLLGALVLTLAAPATAKADKLQDILEAGVIRVTVFGDVPPFGSQNVNRELEGFDIDLAHMLAEALGVELELVQATAANSVVVAELAKQNPGAELDFKFALRRAPAHITVRMGEHNLPRWLDTFIFQQTLNGELNALHEKWLGGPMQPLPPL